MNLPTSIAPVDIKDPRIRITFADVAMRIAHDGPMYGVLLLRLYSCNAKGHQRSACHHGRSLRIASAVSSSRE